MHLPSPRSPPPPGILPDQEWPPLSLAKSLWRNLLLSSQVGIPMDIVIDQGTPLMSQLMQNRCHLLQVHHLGVPPPNRQVGRTLRPDAEADAPPSGGHWGPQLGSAPPISPLHSLRATPSIHGIHPLWACPWGLLHEAKEAWEEQPFLLCSMLEFMMDMQEWIERIRTIVQEHLCATQKEQWCMYNPVNSTPETGCSCWFLIRSANSCHAGRAPTPSSSESVCLNTDYSSQVSELRCSFIISMY